MVVKGGRIDAIGSDVDKPLLSRVTDGGGGVLTAGFVAVGAQLGLDPSRRADPRSVMADGVDRYDRDAIALALGGGVTTACLTPRGVPGIQGIASVVRLMPGAEGGHLSIHERELALCVDLASESDALARLKVLEVVRKTFDDALAHRESLDLYQESLEEYVEALEKAKADSADGKKGDGKPGDGAKGDGEAGGKDSGKKDAKKDDDPPKRPTEPRPREDLEVVLRALDLELPLWITAHRSADIWNAIELARDYDLDLVLVGASEAHLVIDAIVEAEATLLIGPPPEGAAAESGADRRRDADLPALLTRHEVPWALTAGPNIHELLPDALRTVRGGGGDAFRLLTREAANVIGLGGRFARLGRGAEADLVLWSADPMTDPTARVRQVWCGGRSVFLDDAVVTEAPEQPAEAAPAKKKEAL